MKHSTDVGITFNANGGGTIRFCPTGETVERLQEFHTINGGWELVDELLHDEDITPDDATALKEELRKFKIPAVTPNPSVAGLSTVLAGQIIVPSKDDIRKFG